MVAITAGVKQLVRRYRRAMRAQAASAATRRWPLIASALALLVAVTGCARLPAEPGSPPSPASPSSPGSTTPPAEPLLVGSGMVLDDGSGPELCLGAILLSQPPQCQGPPISGWTWPESGTTRVADVTYGSFFVVGTWDGRRLTFDKLVTREQAAASLPPEPAPDLSTPCTQPPDGWPVPDLRRSTSEDQQKVMDLAGALPDLVELWVDHGGDPDQDPRTTVVDVEVTGDLGAAERRLRTVWGGPLCLSHGPHTKTELARVRQELSGEPGSVSSSTFRGVLTLELVHDDGTRQRGYDERFGAGLVRVESVMKPYVG